MPDLVRVAGGWVTVTDFEHIQAQAVRAASVGEALHPGSTEKLMHYWAEGEGAAKIGWGTPGSFRRCQVELGKYVRPDVIDGLCANLYHRATGTWPGRHDGGHKG
jgi:hypothetical protein